MELGKILRRTLNELSSQTMKRKKLEKSIANAEKSSTEADETIEECTEDIASRAEEIAALDRRRKGLPPLAVAEGKKEDGGGEAAQGNTKSRTLEEEPSAPAQAGQDEKDEL